ncbi:MAG: hypothetical protein ACOYK6_02195 [Chthoniobacterales bacterium]
MIPFDAFIAIDWSGSKALLTPSITVAKAASHASSVALVSPPKKEWSRTDVAEWIVQQARNSKRLLIGIDSNFGYAAATVRKRLPHLQAAHELWSFVDTICHQEPNFYAHLFWRESPFRDDFWVAGKKPLHFKPIRRQTESSCITQQLGFPETPFKLIGAKQVGKGGLAAMRMAHFLKKRLQEKIAFWPFDSQEHCNQATIVVAEIYPRLFLKKANHGVSKIRDIKKLKELVSLFQATSPSLSSINDHQADALMAAAGMRHLVHKNNDFLNLEKYSTPFKEQLRIEGWILGVSLPGESEKS